MAALWLALVTLVWGTTFIVNAKVIGREPPIFYLMLRFAVASVLLVPAWVRIRRTPRLFADSVIMGVLLAFGMAFQIAGQTETTASKTAFITGLSVVLTPIFGVFRFRKSPPAAALAGVALATAGFCLLTWPRGGGTIGRGDLMVLGCAVFFALYIVENSVRAPRHHPLIFTAWQIAICTGVLWVLSAWLRMARPALGVTPFECRPVTFDTGFLLAVLYMSTFATIGTFGVQTWAQTKISATQAAIIFALEPVWTAIFAAFILAETLGPRSLAGGALVIAGILVSEFRIKPAAEQPL